MIVSNPNLIQISFKYLVSTDSDEEISERDLEFRLGYDEAEIPISDDLMKRLKQEISEVLPNHLSLNRVGGELSLNGSTIKSF